MQSKNLLRQKIKEAHIEINDDDHLMACKILDELLENEDVVGFIEHFDNVFSDLTEHIKKEGFNLNDLTLDDKNIDEFVDYSIKMLTDQVKDDDAADEYINYLFVRRSELLKAWVKLQRDYEEREMTYDGYFFIFL
jgi:predicted double-glycine peptidase